jgi:hypothetical protein
VLVQEMSVARDNSAAHNNKNRVNTQTIIGLRITEDLRAGLTNLKRLYGQVLVL